MSLKDEMRFPKPVKHKGHETLLNIYVTATLLIKETQQLLRPFGLTDAQFDVLMMLGTQSDDETLNQTELSAMLLVNRSNITGLIDRMEQAGWVQRMPEAGDRRINRIGMTKSGKALLESVREVYITRVDEITSILSTGEENSLCETLEKIRKQLTHA
ncbi:MAG: MarR family winged helix-turn-helix transcriptional regulator [Candidatus Latescibacterota bacterium]